MKKLHLLLILLFFFPVTLAQQTHIFSSKENIFNNWIKRSGETAYQWGSTYHRVGTLVETGKVYEIRNFNCWQWSYNQIPTEASVTSVTIKFRARKGNYPDIFKFSLHTIPYVLNTPEINFFDQCNYNQIYLSSNLIPDANNYVYFNQTFTEQTPVGQGWEVWNAIKNAVQSGTYFLTLGIRERDNSLAPYWSISSYDGTGTSSNPSVELTINYTTPNSYFSFINKIENTENFGTLILNNDLENPLTSGGSPLFLPWASQNSVRTSELPFITNWNGTGTTQKHNYWDLQTSSHSSLYNYFDAYPTSPSVQKATFLPTTSATIKNNFPEAGSFDPATDIIFFYDPWFYFKDENDNWHQSSEFKPYSSPFNIQNNTTDSYGGVFLDQLISSGTYYNIWAGDQQINLGSPIGVRQFYLQNWTSTGADLQAFSHNHQKVVFTSPNATVQANYKGQGLSSIAEAYTNNSQRKAVRLENSNVLLSAYKSLDNKVWLEQSNDNGANWFFKNMPFDNDPVNEYSTTSIDYIPYLGGSHPFAAVVHNLVKLTIIRSNTNVAYYSTDLDINWDPSPNLTLPITPVVAATSSRILVISTGGINQSGQAGLTYHYGTLNFPGTFTVTWTDGHLSPLYKIIPGTNQYSKNVSVVADKNTSNVFHITWQEVNGIKYCKATGSGNNLTFSAVETVSASSPYSSNLYPSISLANGNPVISWTGSGRFVSEKITGSENFESSTSKAIIRRKGTTWGDFQLAGNNVNFTNNNSVSSAQEKTVIVWSEGTTNPQSKWLKRTGSNYSGPCNLSHSGIEAQVIPGSDYQYMTSMVFNNNQLPYYFSKSTSDFNQECSQGGGLEKITNLSDSIVTYGRAGITNINDVAFIFNVGDVIVGDSIVRFIEKPDTLIYSTYEDLNQYTRTDDFQLNSSSQFYFSNLYYVKNIEQADSSLTENDNVNFKVELVNSITNQVVGVFDNITYDKNNLGKYDNISYQVNCGGIQPGNYYLRLVTTVNGEANYALANIIIETANLDKRHYQAINYDGTEKPVTYSLDQNYPNPFNPTTTIRYQLPQDGMVTLKVYDILGSEVATLVNEQKSAGRYEVNFDASRLASGVYIYKLTSGGYVNSKKMLLIK